MRTLTKKQVLAQFSAYWRELVSIDSSVKGDSVMKREEFNNYVDSLNKDGQVSDHQAFNWVNPF